MRSRAIQGKDSFWIALSFCGDGPTEDPAQWVVSGEYDPGLNVLKRLFHRPNSQALPFVQDRIRQVLSSAPGIRVLTD